jgi:putative transposase
MRKSKFNETQIVAILKDAEGGIPVPDVLRKHGISKATFFKWAQQVRRRVRVRRETAARTRRREREAEAHVCGSRARKRRHQGRVEPKVVTPFAKRQVIEGLVADHQLSVQRACRVVRLSRAAFYRPPVVASRRDTAVIAALTDVVARYGRWDFWSAWAASASRDGRGTTSACTACIVRSDSICCDARCGGCRSGYGSRSRPRPC